MDPLAPSSNPVLSSWLLVKLMTSLTYFTISHQRGDTLLLLGCFIGVILWNHCVWQATSYSRLSFRCTCFNSNAFTYVHFPPSMSSLSPTALQLPLWHERFYFYFSFSPPLLDTLVYNTVTDRISCMHEGWSGLTPGSKARDHSW